MNTDDQIEQVILSDELNDSTLNSTHSKLELDVIVKEQTDEVHIKEVLLEICRSGDFNQITDLLDGGVIKYINTFDGDGYTPLLLAVLHNNPKILTLLLSKGAIVDLFCSTRKETPLTLAVILGRFDCMRILLEYGADINIRCIVHTLVWAVNSKRIESVQILLDYGADVNQLNAHELSIVVNYSDDFNQVQLNEIKKIIKEALNNSNNNNYVLK